MEKIVAYFGYLEIGGAYEAESDRRAAELSLGRLVSTAPNYSLWDIYNRFRGFAEVPTWALYQAMRSTDLLSQGLQFQVPIFFFKARRMESLAREYFDQIDAPGKEMVLFEGVGHFAVWSAPDRFLQELVARVRPLAIP